MRASRQDPGARGELRGMSARAKAGVTAIVAAVVVALAALAIAGGPDGDGARPVEILSSVSDRPPRSTADKLVCTGVDEPANFRLYALDPSFAGPALRTVMRTCSTPMPVPGDAPGVPDRHRSNYVSYVYGTCEPPSEEGCAPPLEVQIWPVCERGVDGPLRRFTRRRGVPAAVSQWVELYTADSTVVVFGNDPDLVDDAVAALRPVRPGAAPDTLPSPLAEARRLPPPVPGALTGQLDCA